ncbi:MAG: potassium channel protein [Gammaproteobacteria bacterium]|nr:MAG: potassium channel protein [Gammaproteobacteria bacterium]
MMNAVLFLFFQRMRVPLIVLISAYAIATAGFSLIPGIDDSGDPWRMSLFEAFYVVSYTGSTIGFGEVPYPFTPAQRLWTIVSIYLTVIAWLFAISSIIAMLQDPSCRQAIERARLQRSVRGITEPFYIVCGHGDAGRLLAHALSARRQRVVVIDQDRDSIDRLLVEDLGATVPAFCMDASLPDNLSEAGLRSRWCAGVLAVTGSDQTNLKIAITTKLLNHKAPVYARADQRATAENMRSFATDHVLEPVAEFSRRLRLALAAPDTFRLYHWLSSGPRAVLPGNAMPPRGRWILCSFNPLGRALYRTLTDLGVAVTVIDDGTHADLPEGSVSGRGTEAKTLAEADIHSASAVLALTRDDADNLSILITAREMNPELFLAARENAGANHALYEAAELDFIGRPSLVVAGSILSQISSPQFQTFLTLMQAEDNEFSARLIERLHHGHDERPPQIKTVRISPKRSPAVARALEAGEAVLLEDLCRDPRHRQTLLPVVPLLLSRADTELLCPGPDTVLESGDRIMFAGPAHAEAQVDKTLFQDRALHYVRTGEDDSASGWRRQRGANAA